MKALEDLHIGFIGLGNMGGAVAEGLVRAGIPAEQLYACGGHFDKLTVRCQEISKLAQSNVRKTHGSTSAASVVANVSSSSTGSALAGDFNPSTDSALAGDFNSGTGSALAGDFNPGTGSALAGDFNPGTDSALAGDFSSSTDSTSESATRSLNTAGIHACRDAADVAASADLIFIAIKPGKIPAVLKPISAHFAHKIVVSLAWGYDLSRYEKEEIFPDTTHLLCTIPNTPVSVCKGIFVTEKTSTLTDEEQALVQALLEKISLVIPVETAQLNIGGIIGGCAPAFAEVFMEALADAAVMYGIPRATAYPLVSKMLEGTAALQLASGKHPAAMKDDVCSPGGATIRGIASLEEHAFRGTVIDAVKAIQGE